MEADYRQVTTVFSPTVIPPSALDKSSIMKRYQRRWTTRWSVTARSPTTVALRYTRFFECRWWNDSWTVKTVVTWRSLDSMIPAPDVVQYWVLDSDCLLSHCHRHFVYSSVCTVASLYRPTSVSLHLCQIFRLQTTAVDSEVTTLSARAYVLWLEVICLHSRQGPNSLCSVNMFIDRRKT